MPGKKRTVKNTSRQYATMDQEEHRKFEGKKRHPGHTDSVDELVENPREEERVGRHYAGGPSEEYDQPEERDGAAAQSDRKRHDKAVARKKKLRG